MARDRVVELGAGTGVLTAPLADRAGLVMAIELDAALVARLKSRLAGAGNVLVLHGDALETPLPENPYRTTARRKPATSASSSGRASSARTGGR